MRDTQAVFHLHRPKRAIGPVVFASPHSGRMAPAGLSDRVLPLGRALRSSEDAFVGHLIQPLHRLGAPVLSARFARWAVDLNRARDELDPALIADLPPTRGLNARIAAGLGVIPRVVGGGRVLYHGKITRDEAESRLRALWQPYHSALATLLSETRQTWGQAILIDMHSMPQDACAGLPGTQPDMVLGDRYGGAAAPWVTDLVARALAAEGFSTRRNIPFAGAFIAERYGQPRRATHVVQVEINRALYMDEVTLRPRPDYRDFRNRLTRALAQVARLGHDGQDLPLAAE